MRWFHLDGYRQQDWLLQRDNTNVLHLCVGAGLAGDCRGYLTTVTRKFQVESCKVDALRQFHYFLTSILFSNSQSGIAVKPPISPAK